MIDDVVTIAEASDYGEREDDDDYRPEDEPEEFEPVGYVETRSALEIERDMAQAAANRPSCGVPDTWLTLEQMAVDPVLCDELMNGRPYVARLRPRPLPRALERRRARSRRTARRPRRRALANAPPGSPSPEPSGPRDWGRSCGY
jgi:hypothetical protein